MKEIWKDINGYKGHYQVSNLGRVKSLSRKVRRTIKERILVQYKNSNGYFSVCLFINKKRKTFYVHRLVATAFLNHIPSGYELVVDHIDEDKLNNIVYNLRIVSTRFNVSKSASGSSKYTGVYWDKDLKKWRSCIRIEGKTKHLGSFNNEIDASIAYQNMLKTIES